MALVIDVSRSVGSHTSQCTVASVITMLAALDEVGIEAVTILAFGAKVTLIKAEDQPMDSATVAKLLTSLHFDEPQTRDADAIECVVWRCRCYHDRFTL